MPGNDATTAKGILTAVPDQSEAFFIPSHGEQWGGGAFSVHLGVVLPCIFPTFQQQQQSCPPLKARAK